MDSLTTTVGRKKEREREKEGEEEEQDGKEGEGEERCKRGNKRMESCSGTKFFSRPAFTLVN